jgi:hypothetical protein
VLGYQSRSLTGERRSHKIKHTHQLTAIACNDINLLSLRRGAIVPTLVDNNTMQCLHAPARIGHRRRPSHHPTKHDSPPLEPVARVPWNVWPENASSPRQN